MNDVIMVQDVATSGDNMIDQMLEIDPKDDDQAQTVEEDTASTAGDEVVSSGSAAEEEAQKKDEPQEVSADDKLAALENQVAELQKVNNGLMQAKTSTAKKYGDSKETIQSLTEEIKILRQAQKTQNADTDDNAPAGKVKVDIDFDDDGNAVIDADSLPVNKAMAQKIENLEAKLEATTNDLTASQQERTLAEQKKSFLNEKEGYKEAYLEVQEQWDYIRDEALDQFIVANNIAPPESREEAFAIAMTPEFGKLFSAKFPTGDLETVAQAGFHGNKYYERKALDAVLAKKTAVDSAHEKIPSDKPQSLSTTPGMEDLGDEGFLDMVADMDFEKFNEQSPAFHKRYERLLEARG